MKCKTLTSAVALGCFSIIAGGCLVTSGKSIDESGVRVSQATTNQIEIGETSETWLLATLGEPTERTTIEGEPRLTILRYDHVVTRKSGGTVLFLFAGGSKEREISRTYFEVRDGVVRKHWTEPR